MFSLFFPGSIFYMTVPPWLRISCNNKKTYDFLVFSQQQNIIFLVTINSMYVLTYKFPVSIKQVFVFSRVLEG